MNAFWRNQFSRKLLTGAGITLFAVAVAGATEDQIEDEKRQHTVPDPASATIHCPALLGEYTVAVVALQDAEDAVNAAFETWYDCEMQNGGGYKPTDDSNLVTDTASILDQE